MKKIYTTLFFLLLTHLMLSANDNPVEISQKLIEKKQYTEAFQILNDAYWNKSIPDSSRLLAVYQLAVFYQDIVREHSKAEQYYNEILKDSTKISSDLNQKIKMAKDSLSYLKIKFQEQDLYFESIKSEMRDSSDKKTVIKNILRFIDQNPYYYRLAEVYFYLGETYNLVNKYGKAFKAYNNVLKLQPGMDFQLPVSSYAEIAYEKSKRANAHTLAWSIIGFLLLFTIFVFYYSRPWQWFGLKHLLYGVGLLLLWGLVFLATLRINSTLFLPSVETLDKLKLEKPTFIYMLFQQPGSEILNKFFIYGIMGISGLFVFSIGLYKFKHRKIATIATTLYGLLLFFSLSTIFYLRYCDKKSLLAIEKQHWTSFVKADNVFFLKDPEVYVLKDPKSFSNLNTSGLMLDSEFINWVTHFCHRDSNAINEPRPE